jgi:predicted O-linked N-acetylglucosamine transferase (SPINDLY family)
MANIEILIKAAENYYYSGDHKSAKQILNKIISKKNNSRALEILAYIHYHEGREEQSYDLLKKVATQKDATPSAHYYLAKLLIKKHKNIQSLQQLQAAIRKKSDFFEAWNDMGLVFALCGNKKDAMNAFENAIKINNYSSETYFNIGRLCDELKNYDEAIVNYDKALEINGKFIPAWINKGITLTQKNCIIKAINCFNNAIELDINSSKAWFHLGACLSVKGDYGRAINSFKKAIELDPLDEKIWVSMGEAYGKSKDLQNAIDSYKKAYKINPSGNFIIDGLVFNKLVIGDWADLNSYIDILENGIEKNTLLINPFHLFSISDRVDLHSQANKNYYKNLSFQEKKEKKIYIKKGKKKIGYYSPDFQSHPVGYLITNLIEKHNRTSFEIYGFSFGECCDNDPVRKRLTDSFDYFIDVRDMDDLQVAELSNNLGIDIAIDLSVYTQNSRPGVFANQPAPILINYLGYTGTSGSEYFDYIVGDAYVIPETLKNFYTEKILYMPYSFIVDDINRIKSNKVYSKEEFGLPSDAFIFCCFNNSYKVNEKIAISWANILNAVPKSILWLSENNELYKENILSFFYKKGITCNRILFAKKIDSMGDHLSRIQLADIFLDTYPYNAHTTALDALRVGVPIITISGNTFTSRVASSLLILLGVPELISFTFEEYEEKAQMLSQNSELLNSIKKKLLSSPERELVFDATKYCRKLEEAFELMLNNPTKNSINHINLAA